MTPPARPTLKNVADHAGVSFKTVSRVVNGEPGVSPAMEARVQAAVAALGFQPDHRASLLRSGNQRSETIGFVHADISNPFFSAVHQEFESVVTAKNWLILTGSSRSDATRSAELVEAFAQRRVDGFVIVPVEALADEDELGPLQAELERGTPVVFLDRDPGIPCDLVTSDHRGGARLAAHHLLSHGHTRIAFLGSSQTLYSARERRQGFLEALESVGLEATDVALNIDGAEDAFEVVSELLARPKEDRPTALLTAQNLITAGAVKALHTHERQHGVALVGFDELDLADVIEPGVTLVPQDAAELGRRLADLLLRRLGGDDSPPIREVVPLELIARGSGEIPA